MAWRVAKGLLQLKEQINALAPGRSKASDGAIGDAAHASRKSDHNPWVRDGNIGVVTAIDVTNDVANGCDAQKLVDALVQSRDARIKYIIWNSRIVNSTIQPWVWRDYTGANPHNHHFHISIQSDKAAYDSTAPWDLNGND